MNNTQPITEDYVSFPVAVLLKAKCFREPCLDWYDEHGKLANPFDFIRRDTYEKELQYLRPTQSIVLKWLRVVHGIHVITRVGLGQPKWFDYMIVNINTHDIVVCEENTSYPSPEEATDAAILYCLNNLIK